MYHQQNASVIIDNSLNNSSSNVRSAQTAPFEELNFNLGRSSEIIGKKAYVTVGTPQISEIEVLASGLDGPRKLNFGPSGALYVAEAGRGGTGASIPSPSLPGASLFYGATGAITRIQNGVAERVVTGLPSVAFPNGSDASGVHDIEFDADGNAYAIVGLASNPANRDNLLQIPDFSQLIAIDSFDDGGSWTLLRDFGAYEQNNNPDGQDVNTNLYDLLIKDNKAYVLDTGANDLLSVRAFGSEINLETVFPARSTTDPLTGKTVVRQSVPTSVTVGPDGALYVGELTGFPFQTGTAQVYRINADGQPEVYAGGFTNISDIAFDKSGGLYVLEYDADGILNGSDTGALIYVSPDGRTRTTLTNDELINPTGIEIGTDGDIYISNKGFTAGQGEVLRLEIDNSFKPNSICNHVKHGEKPQVGVTLSSTTVVEGSGIPLVYSFNLSTPAPKGGLQLKFLVSDSDGGSDDASVVGFESQSSNITDTSFAIENGSAFFLIDIAPGAKTASLAVGAYEDNVVEGDETVVFNLVDNKNSYTIDRKNSFVIATIKDAEIVTSPAPITIDFDESWSFKIDDYAIEHQGKAVVDIEVSYDYIDGIGVPDPFQYPDFLPIEKYIENFLVKYPNETDFWEILNKNLVKSLLTELIPTPYGIDYKLADVLDSLTVKIDVESGSSGISTLRSSTVTGKPQKTAI
ncbi:hypothetical protein DSM106972_096540 [Dulcicalothrix desertica PCC 7102]|uniref:Uncharacterized protein n=1 Tax=Dulcicalothrix desertica PCC 7102 TaxID=232991 RepID=A0A3S1AJ37_9CYAN|nr:ScyD/ScyE family protein [Dulcicalothrix desertica]RUS93298.1 hypothetical protein DSM106972_096540 [Dulcicalothrix desertica PCC 7102]TWH62757.1 glucose/arabinose dehydrogenase [Dulcicalothrix desertica PCC 7102]